MKIKYLLVLIIPAFIYSGCSTVYEASSRGDIDQLGSLIGDGADINEKGKDGLTPLMAAAKTNQIEIINRLLSHGANMNLKDKHGKSAIRYAVDNGHFEAFRLLLERGAKVDFDLKIDTASREIYSLLKEYQLVSKIKNPGGKDDLRRFDEYFSIFPNGYYEDDVKGIFKAIVEKDYQSSITSDSNLRSFTKRYSELGKNCYQITADSLNIRQGSSTSTKIAGQYRQGDRIYTTARQYGWIQTDIGWVSNTYLRQLSDIIPIVPEYLQKAEQEIKKRSHKQVKSKTLRVSKQKPLEVEKQSAPVIEKNPPYTKKHQPTTGIQEELDDILKSPTLSNLETFIDKYKDNEEYKEMVKKAREKYRDILLGETGK